MDFRRSIWYNVPASAGSPGGNYRTRSRTPPDLPRRSAGAGRLRPLPDLEGVPMIKITTDSTCDLPARLLQEYGVTVFPLGIVKAGKLYHDGVDIRTADIAAHVEAGGEITTTNAVNAADYEDAFRALTEKYDAVIHINIGSGFSCCHQNAKLAAEEVPEVYVVDSGNLTVGHGMMVLAAADAARAGKSVTEILNLLEGMVPRLETSFVLDRLDYMKKGGRCSAVTALGANLLKLHPCVEVIDGKMSVTKKYRGGIAKVVADYVGERLRDRTDLDLSLIHI